MKKIEIHLSTPIPKKLLTEVGYGLNRLDPRITRTVIDPNSQKSIHAWFFKSLEENDVQEMIKQFTEDFLSEHSGDDDSDEEPIPRKIINENLVLHYAPSEIPSFDKNKLLWVNRDGQVVLGDVLLKLKDELDKAFKSLGVKYNAKELAMPSFIPMSFFEKNWYFMQYPNHIVFPMVIEEKADVINSFKKSVHAVTGKVENINEYLNKPTNVLSPATCFHIHNFIGQHPQILVDHSHYTAVSTCFRYESSNIFLMERSNTFNMRELVFYGTEEQIDEILVSYEKDVVELLAEWEIKGFLLDANDPFYVKSLPKNVTYNLPKNKKWELRLDIPCSGKSIACASFNRHGDFFLKNAGVSSEPMNNWVSGCVAFGLERWIWTILCQYGTNPEKWPNAIRKMAGLV